MLMPKRVKYRKVQRGRMTGAASRGNKVAYGDFGIQALEPGWITGNQIEAARIAMTRYTKRGGKVWIKIFPDTVRNISVLCKSSAEKQPDYASVKKEGGHGITRGAAYYNNF